STIACRPLMGGAVSVGLYTQSLARKLPTFSRSSGATHARHISVTTATFAFSGAVQSAASSRPGRPATVAAPTPAAPRNVRRLMSDLSISTSCPRKNSIPFADRDQQILCLHRRARIHQYLVHDARAGTVHGGLHLHRFD